MNKVTSLYLDLLRVVASLYVFIYHFYYMKLEGRIVFTDSNIYDHIGFTIRAAHYFVIVFFVLSGLLITMSTTRPNMTFKKFIIARLGRLYSVLFPALILSFLCVQYLIQGNFYDKVAIGNTSNIIIRFFLNLSFLAESWNLNATPPLNTPFWSVHYEFLYYIIISSILLIKGKIKFFIIPLVLLLAGLKVLILFPCWLLGSAVYYLIKKDFFLPPMFSFIVFISSTFFIFLILKGDFILPFEFFHKNKFILGLGLFFSSNYQSDYIFAFLVALNVYSIFGFSKKIEFLSKKKNFIMFDTYIKVASNCSYTLYLFHVPLLFIFSTANFYNRNNYYHQIGIVVLVLFTVYFIAKQTEWKVTFWRSIVQKVFEFMELKIKSRSLKA